MKQFESFFTPNTNAHTHHTRQLRLIPRGDRAGFEPKLAVFMKTLKNEKKV